MYNTIIYICTQVHYPQVIIANDIRKRILALEARDGRKRSFIRPLKGTRAGTTRHSRHAIPTEESVAP